MMQSKSPLRKDSSSRPPSPKSGKNAKRPKSPKDKKVVAPPRVSLPTFHTLTTEPTEEWLQTTNGYAVLGLTLEFKLQLGFAFLKAFSQLKWLEASGCQITDEQLLHFPQLVHLEVLLLNDNLLSSTKPLTDFPLMMPDLAIISLANNQQLLADGKTVQELGNIFKNCLLITTKTP